MHRSPQARVCFVLLVLVYVLGVDQSCAFAQDPSKDLTIKEFMAINSSDLPLSQGEILDSNGESSDWIEIYNTGTEDVNLAGWFLTDNLERLDKWAFPGITLKSHDYLVVFASGKDKTEPDSELHTNFKLSAKGESIAIVRPDGKTISDQIAYDQQYANISFGQAQDYRGYILEPTPGKPNTGSLAQIGPEIIHVIQSPNLVQAYEPFTVTAQVDATLDPVDEVWLVVRLDYLEEDMLFPDGGIRMLDNGVSPDEVAGDHIYSATIPQELAYPGAMLRWYVRAIDQNGQASRNPLFPWQDNSPAYYGTVVQNPTIASDLPILYWFTQDKNAARSRSGTRACLFYDGEFYDNIFVRRRGGATVGSDSKKFVFNKGHKFRLSDEVDRVEEFNFNQNGSDASYGRQPLAFETHRLAGCPSPLCFLMMSAVNNEPDRVGVYVEQINEEFLERNDLDSRGALYKFVQRSKITPVFSDITTGIEKKNRQHEDFSDIAAVVDAINSPFAIQQEQFVFDNFNLPSMINYLAARCLLQDTDDIRKNFYFYRDTEGSGLWSIFPWDKDWTFGIAGDGGVYTSHPFLGDTAHPKNNNRQWNLYLTVMYNTPRTREMYLRRLRTVMDQWLQSSNTPVNERFFENRVDELLDPALADLGNKTGAINSLKSYFPKRRTQLYVDHSINYPQSSPPGGNVGIPNAQSENALLQFGQVESEPESGNQDEEYIEIINPNNYAVDISDWKLTEGITHTFHKGTVICAGDSLFVSPDLKTFNDRTASPKRGEGLFVQGDYKGHLAGQGETVQLINAQGQIISTLSYTRQ